jgi:ribonuclease BN (tRNA processing enzyme)
MEMVFIGTGCGIPCLRRAPASLLVKVEGDILWFDTGPGSLRKLLEAGYTCRDVDYVIYTHYHLDHIADFGPLIFASRYELNPRIKDLTVIGPPGMREFYRKLLDLYGKQIQNLIYNVNVIEHDGKFSGESWELESIKTLHTSQSIGYKLKDKNGKVIAYPGDTEYFPGLVEFVKGVDVLILECAFPKPVPTHLNPLVVGEIAEAAGVGQLIITHLYPVCDEEDILTPIRAKFNGKVTIAEDLMRFEV